MEIAPADRDAVVAGARAKMAAAAAALPAG
jgi:hypothetical protein